VRAERLHADGGDQINHLIDTLIAMLTWAWRVDGELITEGGLDVEILYFWANWRRAQIRSLLTVSRCNRCMQGRVGNWPCSWERMQPSLHAKSRQKLYFSCRRRSNSPKRLHPHTHPPPSKHNRGTVRTICTRQTDSHTHVSPRSPMCNSSNLLRVWCKGFRGTQRANQQALWHIRKPV
jgi:hypothetical protein